MNKVIITQCVNCGAPVDSENDKACKYCKAPIIIKTLADLAKIPNDKKQRYVEQYKKALLENSGDIPLSIALILCHIGARNYPVANRLLDNLIDDHCQDANVFYYKALCLLEGTRPRTMNYETIENIRAHINSANEICGGDPIYYVFLAVLQLDYFNRYGFNYNCGKNAKELCHIANSLKVNTDEVQELLNTINISSDICHTLDKYLDLQ